MIGRLRQLSEPRLRQQAGIEKSLTPVERDIYVQWVRNLFKVCFKVLQIETVIVYTTLAGKCNLYQKYL